VLTSSASPASVASSATSLPLSRQPLPESVARADAGGGLTIDDGHVKGDGEGTQCPVCDCSPHVLIAVRHATMRRLILELLEREHGCWTPVQLEGELSEALATLEPELVVIDADRSAFQDLRHPWTRFVLIGREPDPSARSAAVARGAGGWLARECIADDLSQTMRRALGCVHAPCPVPARVGRRYVDVRSTNP